MFKRIWYPEAIADHILSRYGKEAINSHYYATTYPDVYAAAERIFGSWRAAIEACGFRYEDIRKYRTWTRELVLEEIRRHYVGGESISSQHAQQNFKPLYMAALKRFRSWGVAVQTAGIRYEDVRRRRSMDKEEIKKAILELYRNREDLSYTGMRANHQYLLAAGMKKLGNGSWARARLECGILRNYRAERGV